MQQFNVGDKVVYRTHAQTGRSNQGAGDGGAESYIDEYCRVTAVASRKIITVRQSNGKGRSLRKDDPCLRRASLVERLVFADRFRAGAGLALAKEDFDYAFDWRGAQRYDSVG